MTGTPISESHLRRYLGAESALGAVWSPDGRTLAYVLNRTGTHQIYLLDPDGGASSRRIVVGDDRCTDPRFLPDGRVIFTSDSGGDENFQLYLADPEGSARRLTTDDGAKHRVVSISGEELLFVANDQDRSRFTLYSQLLPFADWKPSPVYTPDRGIIRTANRMDDGTLVAEVAYGNMHQELFLLVPGTDASSPSAVADVRSLTHGTSGGGEIRWRFIRPVNGRELLVASDLDSDVLRPMVLTIDGNTREVGPSGSNAEWELSDATHVPDRQETYLEFNEDGYSRLYLLPDPDSDLRPVALPAESVVTSGDGRTSRIGMALSPDGTRLAAVLSGPDRVTNVWILDIRAGSWHQVTDAAAAGLSAVDFVDCSLHRFESFDGLSIPYFRFLPVPRTAAGSEEVPGAGHPAVFLIHGGPEAQARPVFNPVVQFLVAAGFAVIMPNIRGSAGYGRRYLDLDNREKRLDSISDIAELARHLSECDSSIDGNRLAILGGSYGGFAVLSAMTEHPALWKAGVDIVGISNFVTFLTNTAPWRRKLREAEYGSLDDAEMLARISPINRIEAIAAPLLIIQGDNDERVPLSESVQMYERLRSLGRTVELMRFADEGHGVTTLSNRVTAYTRVAEWLREYL